MPVCQPLAAGDAEALAAAIAQLDGVTSLKEELDQARIHLVELECEQQLCDAIYSADLESLREAIQEASRVGFSDENPSVVRAVRDLQVEQSKKVLNEAIGSRDIEKLAEAIEEVRDVLAGQKLLELSEARLQEWRATLAVEEAHRLIKLDPVYALVR